jgi:hypothetical protein
MDHLASLRVVILHTDALLVVAWLCGCLDVMA